MELAHDLLKPTALPPDHIQQATPQKSQVGGVDNSIGLLPEPTPFTPPPGILITPSIITQRFDGKATVRMPCQQNSGCDWYADGWITGKRGLLEQLQQVKLSNGDTISALPCGMKPLTTIKKRTD
jgi:hypothetical protein